MIRILKITLSKKSPTLLDVLDPPLIVDILRYSLVSDTYGRLNYGDLCLRISSTKIKNDVFLIKPHANSYYFSHMI